MSPDPVTALARDVIQLVMSSKSLLQSSETSPRCGRDRMIDDATLTEWERSEYPWAAEMAREIRRLSAEKEEFDLAEHRHTIPFLGKQATCEEVIRRLREIVESICQCGAALKGGRHTERCYYTQVGDLAAHRAVVRELAEVLENALVGRLWTDTGRKLLAHPLVQQAREEKA